MSESFNQIYKTRLKPTLRRLSRERELLKQLHLVRALIFIVYAPYFLALYLKIDLASLFPPYHALMQTVISWAGWAFLIFTVFSLIIFFYSKTHRAKYKNGVMKVIVDQLFPAFLYLPDSHISEKVFRASHLFSQRANRFQGDDYIAGSAKRGYFECSELLVQYETDGRNKKVHTIFSGLFMATEIQKACKGIITLHPDFCEEYLGSYLGRIVTKSSEIFDDHYQGEVTILEHPEFEKYFTVRNTVQGEAHYFLTPTLQEKLVSLRKRLQAPIALALDGQKLYLAISFREPLFEPALFSTKGLYQQMAEIELLLKEIIQLPDAFK